MEKYYCDNCRLLYDGEDNCLACGRTVTNRIWIEVQNQPSSKEITPD